ncbi:MAG TPA: AMP-binding protein [Xanthobacteraceae bacterium]|nr:AMP-binding protein [Xanthobacteraceae bacterium]
MSRLFSCLGDLLDHYGRASPDRDAISGPGSASMTYEVLRAYAKDTIRALRSVGIGQSDRVAVALPDGPETAAAIISVAAGAVCAPLNPSFTADEWRRYLAELRAAALLTHPAVGSASRTAASGLGIPVLDLMPQPGAFTVTGPARPRIKDDNYATADGDALILLTSGTTSRPKTIPLTHASVCRSAYNVGAAIELKSRDRLLSVLPLFHGHGLISGVIAALAAGSSVVCTAGFDAEVFLDWLTKFQPTWYTAVPAIHRAVLSAAESDEKRARRSSLRLIRSASSTLPAKLLSKLETMFDVPVIDTFGMTEAATQVAANPLDRRKPGSVGRAAGAEITILDAAGRRLSAGKHGEIALRGPTITRGYDNDAVATREVFRNGWFRTGDLGYLDDEGYLFLVGRLKEVINRGGQKIAPGEVEEALLSHPDVVEAAVFAVPHVRLGADVAAAVVLSANAAASASTLRNFLRKRLASFKVPGLVRIVPHIPKGAGGKIKRAELAAALSLTEPDAGMRQSRKSAAPRSELERQTAKIWADLLDIDEVGVAQDVFALGVDSITLTQMISRLRQRFDVDLVFKDIFEAPTVASLAARIHKLKKISNPGSLDRRRPARTSAHTEKFGPQPVAIVQERMLRIERELPGLPQFNLPFAYRLKGQLNVKVLERCLREVVRRHDSLRTGFGWRGRQPVAFITPPSKIKRLLTVENLAAAEPARNSAAKALLRKRAALVAEQESLNSFDISRAPLFRARLLRLGDEDHVLLLVVHDIIIDGWSMGVFMEEVGELYAAFAAGKKAQLPEPALRFSDFARWQRQWSNGSAASRQFGYWHRHLRTALPVFAANADSELGAGMAQERLHIPNNVLARLSDVSHRRGVTPFVTLLAGFKTLLLLRTGRNDICVATAMANRAQLGTQNVIGPFANTAIIRTRVEPDLTFYDALDRVREAVLQAYARQELPFDVLADRLAEEHGFDPETLIQAYFVLQIAFRRLTKLSRITVRPFGYREGQSVMPIDRTWLTMTLNETPSGIIGACRGKSDLFAGRRWVDDYNAILAEAAANPQMPLGRFGDSPKMRLASSNTNNTEKIGRRAVRHSATDPSLISH